MNKNMVDCNKAASGRFKEVFFKQIMRGQIMLYVACSSPLNNFFDIWTDFSAVVLGIVVHKFYLIGDT